MILAEELTKKILQSQAETLDTFNFNQNIDVQPLTQEFFNSSWKEIEEFLNSLYYSENELTFCFQYFYELVGSLSNYSTSFCVQLAYNLQVFHSQHFSSLLEQLASSEEGDFSDKIAKQWLQITHCVDILSEIFKDFEICHLINKQTANLKFEQFIINVLADQMKTKYSSVLKMLISSQMSTFNDIRDGKPFDRVKLQNLISMTRKIGVFEIQFKHVFLEESEEYYEQLSLRYFFNQSTISMLLDEIDLRLHNEKDLIEMYLSNSIGVGLIKLVQQCLIRDHLKEIVHQGLFDYLNKKDYKNVTRVYQNILAIDQFEYLKHNWKIHVQNRVEFILKMDSQGTVLTQLLGYFKELENILAECFQNIEQLIIVKNNALEEIFSNNCTFIAELASNYIDNLLRVDKKFIKNEHVCTNSAENDLIIERYIKNTIMQLLRYLPEKDMFEGLYDRLLIKRVLVKNSYSPELEKLALVKLKAECGEQFATKSEEILTGIEKSNQLNEDFNKYLFKNLKTTNLLSIFSVTVISFAAWPLKNMQLPSLQGFQRFFSFNEFQRQFETFYSTQHKGVGLKWQNAGSFCEIEGSFNKYKYIFHGELIQGLILLSFNFKKQHSFEELLQLIPIEKQELLNSLVSLYDMKKKSKVLNKTGDSDHIQNGDLFEINDNYTSNKLFVKLNSFFKEETKKNIEQTSQGVLTERGFMLDANIVKIVKKNKSITQSDLISKLSKEFKIHFNVIDLNTRIQGLIENDYIRRDVDKPSLYHYVV